MGEYIDIVDEVVPSAKYKMRDITSRILNNKAFGIMMNKKLVRHFGIKVPIVSKLLKVVVLNYLFEKDPKAISELYGASETKTLDFKIRNEVGGTEKALDELYKTEFAEIGSDSRLYSLEDKFCIVKLDTATYAIINEPYLPENNNNGKVAIHFTLYFIGKGAYRELYKFRKYVEEWHLKKQVNSTQIFIVNGYKIDVKFKELNISDSSLIVDNGILSSVYSYIDNVFSLANKPLNVAVKNRLHPGILLYGEPGTGKSTFIEVIAKKYNAAIVYINAAKMSQIEFDELLPRLHRTYTIFVFEDIDIVCQRREDTTELIDRENLNTLLQLLDGGMQIEGMKYIQIATTNHIDALDPALTRCGRFDMKIEMTGLFRDMAEKLCDSFEVGYEVLDDETFPINPSYLQAKILRNMKTEIINEVKGGN
jgi:hypothetical protein